MKSDAHIHEWGSPSGRSPFPQLTKDTNCNVEKFQTLKENCKKYLLFQLKNTYRKRKLFTLCHESIIDVVPYWDINYTFVY